MESELPITQKQDLTLSPWGEEILVQKVMLEKVERGESPAYQKENRTKAVRLSQCFPDCSLNSAVVCWYSSADKQRAGLSN